MLPNKPLKLAARARDPGLRLLQPAVQVGQLRLNSLPQGRLVFEPAQPGNLLEHLIARLWRAS